eukprot:6202796-Pleurochrysis_carterae.AAC.1
MVPVNTILNEHVYALRVCGASIIYCKLHDTMVDLDARTFACSYLYWFKSSLTIQHLCMLGSR